MIEQAYRWGVVRVEELPKRHQDYYREKYGEVRTHSRTLYLSFRERVVAEATVDTMMADPDRPSFYTYEVVDLKGYPHLEIVE